MAELGIGEVDRNLPPPGSQERARRKNDQAAGRLQQRVGNELLKTAEGIEKRQNEE